MEEDSIPSRRTVLKSVGASSFAALAGCAGENGSSGAASTESDTSEGDYPDLSGQEVHIVVGYGNKDVQDLLTRVGQEFNEETGASVNTEFTSFGSGVPERLTQLVQAGSAPDIVGSATAFGTQLVEQGLSEPVTNIMDEITGRLGEVPENGQLVVDDEQHIITTSLTPCGFFYRDDIYEQKPSDWDTLLEEAEVCVYPHKAATQHLKRAK